MTLHNYHPLVKKKEEDNSHLLLGFSKYVTKGEIIILYLPLKNKLCYTNNYSVKSIVRDCYLCKRNKE